MFHITEWMLFFIFLICILLTVKLLMMIYKRTIHTARHRRETAILDGLVRLAHSELDQQEHRLQAILKTIVDVFPSYKIDDCYLLQPDITGMLQVQAHTSQPIGEVIVSHDEQDIATWVLTYGYDMSLYESFPHIRSTHSHRSQRAIISASMEESTTGHYVRFLPLKVGMRTVGVLRLSIRNDAPFFPYHDMADKEEYLNTSTAFFWTFLSQVAILIDKVPVAESVSL